MNCEEIRRHWDLYHDSEGDAGLHLQINEHLASCEACSRWFFANSQLEDAVAERLSRSDSDPMMWKAVLLHAGVTPARRPRSIRTLALCMTCVILAVLIAGFVFLAGDGEPSLSASAASMHDRLASGDLAPPFLSDSDHDIEGYLRKEVGFPVRCPPRKNAGFLVHGAGTCRMEKESAAYLLGRVDGAPVSIFVLPRQSLYAFPHQQAALDKEQVHRCREGKYEMALAVIDQNVVLVIGQTQPERLLRVLRAYGSYPHDAKAG